MDDGNASADGRFIGEFDFAVTGQYRLMDFVQVQGDQCLVGGDHTFAPFQTFLYHGPCQSSAAHHFHHYIDAVIVQNAINIRHQLRAIIVDMKTARFGQIANAYFRNDTRPHRRRRLPIITITTTTTIITKDRQFGENKTKVLLSPGNLMRDPTMVRLDSAVL